MTSESPNNDALIVDPQGKPVTASKRKWRMATFGVAIAAAAVFGANVTKIIEPWVKKKGQPDLWPEVIAELRRGSGDKLAADRLITHLVWLKDSMEECQVAYKRYSVDRKNESLERAWIISAGRLGSAISEVYHKLGDLSWSAHDDVQRYWSHETEEARDPIAGFVLMAYYSKTRTGLSLPEPTLDESFSKAITSLSQLIADKATPGQIEQARNLIEKVKRDHQHQLSLNTGFTLDFVLDAIQESGKQ